MLYVAMTKDEAQRRRWTFYEVVIIGFSLFLYNIAMKAIKPSRKEGKGDEDSQGGKVQQGAL